MDLIQAHEDFCTRLKTRKVLRDVGASVQDMRPRTAGAATMIVDQINKVLLGQSSSGARVGLAFLVPLPGFRNPRENIPDVIGELVLTAVVLENVMQNMGPNGTRMTCEEAAAHLMLAGHHFQFGDNRLLRCDGMRPLDPEGEGFSADIAYEVTFVCQAGFRQLASCSQPLITVHGSELTIVTTTANAEIYMTTDGSMPWPGNAQAVSVSGPLTKPQAGTIIRAAAYREDLEPSSPAWFAIA